MRRRDVFPLISGVAIWPLAARAQQPAMPVIAFLNGGSASAMSSLAAAFRKGLGETGYVDGENVNVEYYWLEGHYERLPTVLDDLIQRRVAVIAVPGSTPASIAAKAATSTIPIVFGVAENPVTLGLVVSLAHPGGNATGINFFAVEIDAKRLGLMHELLPKVKRIAALVNPASVAYTEATTKALGEAARTLGLEIPFFRASSGDEIDAAFAAIAREGVEALFIAGDGFFFSRAAQFAAMAARSRLPASFAAREMVEAGLLMSYGTSIAGAFRQVGIYSGTILKGVTPAELPVLQSTRFELVINLKTARSLGVDIPPMLLARADEVIE